jgi:hypothetical protein
MNLAVLGVGMVSAAGARARDHAFFPRAEAPAPLGSPFRAIDDRPTAVRRAPFVSGFDDLAGRMHTLAALAIDEALGALGHARPSLALWLCAPEPRPGFGEEAREECLHAIASRVRPLELHRLSGAAAPLAALRDLRGRLGGGPAQAAVVVAVDSFVSLADATGREARPPSPWLVRPAPPGEGAAAIVVTTPERQAAWRLPALATIRGASSALSHATDENDEPIDGRALTSVLADLATERVGAVFGQDGVDHLRVGSWGAASARLAPRLHHDCVSASLETEVGRLGSAAGLMGLAYAVSALRHETCAPPTPNTIVWAVSQDGLTAGARLVPGAPDVLVALAGGPSARQVARAPHGDDSPLAATLEDDDSLAEDEPGASDPDEVARDVERLLCEEAGEEAAVEAANDPGGLSPAPPLFSGAEPLPLVRVDPRARLVPLPAFYTDVVARCAETTAVLVDDRRHGPWGGVPEVERRLLCQLDAIVATGGTPLDTLAAFWRSDPEDAAVAGAATLGLLAFDGADAAVACRELIDESGDDEHGGDIVAAIAEAIALAQHPASPGLVRDLGASEHAPSRAVALCLGIQKPERIALALTDDSTVVRRAAVWACDRLGDGLRDGFAPWLEACLVRSEAWDAARQLALWGNASALSCLDAFEPHQAVELMVLAAHADEDAALPAQLGRGPAAPALVDAAARWGSARALEWLLALLVDPVLAEHAGRGLVTMLGPLVERRRVLDTSAWRSALGELRLDPRARYRRGRRWSPAAVLEECGDARLSRAALGLRVDELRARLGAFERAELWRWQPAGADELASFIAAAHGRR